ncbi:type II toxin-antitoxin system RelE/ParE family toxin [Dongia sedimenti]|uniref:Type II toxin-antitoxin system RelE/ParE family toxin n=1 Tax=Dongia sedimenti TaxID=3064282 RepID=A0ABU0YV25_9PROT|nr:type II toxin-antitoxin system RelE/ParE family toxin [Rhodospirillaceae bacterium R-7]
MADFRLSGPAAAELDEILDWSETNFGPEARERYNALVFEAIQNVAGEAHQANVRWHRVRSTDIGVYHIEHSRDRVSVELGRVGEPRHYLILTIGADGVVEILGFVHDSMLLKRAFRKLVPGKR